MKAAQTKPDQLATQVKSLTQNTFGAGALKLRFTRSSGHAADLSLKAVRCGLPRTTPFNPMAFISLETVQRATSKPSRSRCRQTLRTP
jgi:hypothetical protein